MFILEAKYVFNIASYKKNRGRYPHMGADFIQRGDASKFLIPPKPKNGSRGGDTFCPPRGGVEGWAANLERRF